MYLYLNLYLYSKELSLGNQPLETQRWTWPQFLGNWLAGPSVSKKHTGLWKLSAGFGPSFLETGWLAQEVRFPTLSSLLYVCIGGVVSRVSSGVLRRVSVYQASVLDTSLIHADTCNMYNMYML